MSIDGVCGKRLHFLKHLSESRFFRGKGFFHLGNKEFEVIVEKEVLVIKGYSRMALFAKIKRIEGNSQLPT